MGRIHQGKKKDSAANCTKASKVRSRSAEARGVKQVKKGVKGDKAGEKLMLETRRHGVEVAFQTIFTFPYRYILAE